MDAAFESYRITISEEDKQVIRDSLEETVASFTFHHIGFVGVLGNIQEQGASKDIDVVMFTAPNRKIGESLIESSHFYQALETTVKQEHPRYHLSIFPMKVKQELTNYINSVQRGEKGMIPIHDLFFPDKHSMRQNSPDTFVRSVEEDITPLHGDYDNIPDRQGVPLDDQKPYFRLIEYTVLSIHGRFPEKLVKAKIEGVFDYLATYHNITIPDENYHTRPGILRASKNILRQLDRRYYDD